MKNQRGFTLVEVILMIGLMAILSTLVMPLFSDIGASKIDAASRKLKVDLFYARQLARTRNATYGVSFDEVQNTYSIFLYDSLSGTKTPITDPLTQQPMNIHMENLPGLTGVVIKSPNFGGSDEIHFTPSGIPQGGSGPLLTVGTVVLQEGGKILTLFVQPNTGEVNVL